MKLSNLISRMKGRLDAEENILPASAETLDPACAAVRAEFSPYLDGRTTGVEMAAIAQHLDACRPCAAEFSAWRSVQTALGRIGKAKAPARLQARLMGAIAIEKARGTHLSPVRRLAYSWRLMAPMALRLTGGFAAAIVLLGTSISFLDLSGAVLANDDDQAHLIAPQYIYSQVPPQPIETRHDVPILVEARVDTDGRVYDYRILEGPKDRAAVLQVEQNLLVSVFRPATVFGVPVKGHVMMTYAGVSVRG